MEMKLSVRNAGLPCSDHQALRSMNTWFYPCPICYQKKHMVLRVIQEKALPLSVFKKCNIETNKQANEEAQF
ncbi:MAG: hypothetical protein LBJ01_10445, partial [Tannerella sp.]|nr:hypothetical protein [Tannerella sp.]